MSSAVPDWLTPVAWTFISLSLLSAVVVAGDIYLFRRRQPAVTTELVWVSSTLYLGPIAVAAYVRWGRAERASPVTGGSELERRSGAAFAVLPGGGASAVAHLIAVPLVVALGWTIAGLAMWPMIAVIAVLAIVMLVAYERVRSPELGGGRARRLSLWSALAAAATTVAAFDVGMVGWMLLLHFNGLMPAVTEGTFWFLMQVGVIVGLATGYPAVRWLLGRTGSTVPA